MKNKKRKEDHTLPILVLRETFLVLKSDYNFVKCLRIVLSNTYCVVLCFCFVFLRLMLSVSLCFSSSCVPYVVSFSVFFFVLCTLCCQFLCVFLRLVYPMLSVSLDYPFMIAPSNFYLTVKRYNDCMWKNTVYEDITYLLPVCQC